MQDPENKWANRQLSEVYQVSSLWVRQNVWYSRIGSSNLKYISHANHTPSRQLFLPCKPSPDRSLGFIALERGLYLVFLACESMRYMDTFGGATKQILGTKF